MARARRSCAGAPVREAALARASAAVGARGEAPYELLAGAVRATQRSRAREAERALATLARVAAAETVQDSKALVAQSRQAERCARLARERG